MINAQKYFILFANSIMVKGYTRDCIVDVQHGRILPVPQLLTQILEQCKEQIIDQVKAFHNHMYDEGMDTYLGMLEEEQYGFFTDEPSLFPPMSLEWDYPGLISNVMLDVSESSHFAVEPALDKLIALKPRAMAMRFFRAVSVTEIDKLLMSTVRSCLTSIQLILPWQPGFNLEGWVDLICTHLRINSLVVYAAPETGFQEVENPAVMRRIFFTEQKIHPLSPEQISLEHMLVDMTAFTEAQEHNLALNRKLCIDHLGQIKNHPLHSQSFGHVDEPESLFAIVNSAEFQQRWRISHDQVSTCRDCEFRYCCVDHDELVEDKEGFRRSEECNYDPYQGVWKEPAGVKVFDT